MPTSNSHYVMHISRCNNFPYGSWFIMICSSDCSTVFPGIPTFGENCTNRCHCINDEQCNITTGECENGCEFGWMGPKCQYRKYTPVKKKPGVFLAL